MNPTLRECADGGISPPVAISRLLFAGADAAGIAAALDAAGPHPHLDAIRTLLHERGAQIEALSAQVAATVAEHHAHGATPADGIANIARFFDRAVAASPEASVALYSLGDGAILAEATDEIVAWLEAQGLLGAERDVVDLGCGIGRVAAALAGRCRQVLGLDVSAGMVAEARRRHDGLANVRFAQTAGQDLDGLEAASSDLIIAVDSFPYVLQAGEAVVAAHLHGARRALRAGGALALLNVSYEPGDDDGAVAAGLAERFGFEVAVAGVRPFRLWDGTACVLRR